MLEYNAYPNIPTSNGTTPLMMAAVRGFLPILQTLLKLEAISVDAADPDTDYTAFHVACAANCADCATELIRHGCNTKLQTKDGETGLDMAKRHGHGVLIRRCKGAQKLALRKVQQQATNNAASLTPATADSVPQADEDAEQQKKAAKKTAANRKKKARKKAKKAAEQQLILSQPELEQSLVQLQPELMSEPELEVPKCPAQQAEAEPEPEPEPELQQAEAEPELQTEAEPVLNERTHQLQALTALGVQQWSAAQVLEWVALVDLPSESVSVVGAVIESLDLDGRDFLDVTLRMLHRKLAKHGGVQDAEALAKQVIEQRDALLLILPGDSISAASPLLKQSNSLECPICMKPFCDDESGLRVPRFLTGCGHTVCHGCITKLLSQGPAVKKNKKTKKGAKTCKCPSCEAVTEVEGGDATNLFRNYALASAVEEAV